MDWGMHLYSLVFEMLANLVHRITRFREMRNELGLLHVRTLGTLRLSYVT